MSCTPGLLCSDQCFSSCPSETPTASWLKPLLGRILQDDAGPISLHGDIPCPTAVRSGLLPLVPSLPSASWTQSPSSGAPHTSIRDTCHTLSICPCGPHTQKDPRLSSVSFIFLFIPCFCSVFCAIAKYHASEAFSSRKQARECI